MALKLEVHYPNRFDSPSTEYPQGKWRNRSDSTANDGGYLEQDWLNDEYGFRGALLVNGGVTPDGTIDTAQRSQVYEALINVITANQQDTSGFLLKANLSSVTGQRTDTAMTQKAVTDALDGKRDSIDLVFDGIARFNGTGNDGIRINTSNGGSDGVVITYNSIKEIGFYNVNGDFTVHLPRKTGVVALLSDATKLGSEQSTVTTTSGNAGVNVLDALSLVPNNCVVTRLSYTGGGGTNTVVRAHYRSITRI